MSAGAPTAPPCLEAWAGESFYLATVAPHVVRALRSFAHGTLTLELDRRFAEGSDLDLTWRAGGDALMAADLAATGDRTEQESRSARSGVDLA